MNQKYTAYCGLCCVDCMPSKGEFFSAIQHLEGMLDSLQYREYAKLKSKKISAFLEYPTFLRVLKAIKSLRCAVPCRNGGGIPECKIRRYAQQKGHNGCWECDEHEQCKLLAPLKKIHPHLDYHLGLIKKFGMAGWFKKRRAHYKWQK